MRRLHSSSFFVLCTSLVLGLSSFGAARADEYSVVPKGDAILRNLSVVQRSGWITSSRSVSDESGQTRYELALQTAAAIFLVSAHIESDASWTQSVSSVSLTALRDLTLSLRVELQKLGVDTQSFLPLLARASKNTAETLRQQESAGESASPFPSTSTKRNMLPYPSRFKSSALSQNNGLSLGLGRGFALRVGVRPDRTASGVDRLSLSESPLPTGKSASIGGGLDWAPRSGLTFSTNIESVIGGAQDGAVRFSSGVGILALDNRVSLVANYSRLKMENVDDASAMAGVNLGVGISSNVSLNLLYQQLFSTPTPSRSDRVLAGGVSVKF